MINKRNLFKRIISILTVVTIIVPTFTQLAISAEETDKYPYNIFGRNGIEINAGNLCINGDVHTNKEANITAYGKNINGKITTGNDIKKRVKHVYADTKIYEKYFTENCELYEDGYVKSEMNIHINSPIFSYRNIELDGNVALNSNIGTLMNINVTGEVKNANTSVVYSKYGNITIENDSTANINGLIYAPLGTLTINSPNVSINGVIIADKIIINGNSINLNGNDNIARFIGTESEVYDFSYLVNLPESWFLDTDNDELFDFYEKVIDTDFLNSDTDGDILPDGYEVLTLNTDPLEVDTDENGVSDADEDFDNDNLNNLGEYENKTEPFNPDTDDDGLLDGDEIKKYKTDPLNPDTDNDGLLDGDEIKLGFDPLNPQAFGIPDSEYETKQDISSDSQVFSQINTEENPFNVSLQIDSTGCVESNITVEESAFLEIIDNDSLIGVAPEFQCDDTCKISKAVLKFTIDSEKLESVSGIFSDIGELQGMKRFCIFKYFEDMNILLPVETLYNENLNTIYTETEELGTYCVMDMESWISSFGFDEEEQYNEEQYQYPDEAAPMSIEETPDKNELTEIEKEQCSVKIFDSHIDEYGENEIESYANAITANTTTTQQTPLDVVFIIEQAGTQKEAFERQKRAIQYASRNLCAMQEDVRIYIIGFNKNSAQFYKATSLNYLTNAGQVNAALSKIGYTKTNDYCNRGTAFNLVLNNVQFRNYAARFAFLILNGATTVSSGYKNQLDFCAKRDVNYSEVMASGYDYNSNYDQQVKKASLKSNGIFIHDNQQLQFLIYGHIQRNIARPNTVFNISLPTSWNGINLKGALSPTNKVDSDSDGLTDWKEADIECGLIKWDNSGNIILPKFKDCISRASEKEAVHSAFLTYYKYLPRSINYILNASVLPIHSNPCSKDSDEDGFNDKEDPYKLKSDIKVLNLSNSNYINIYYNDKNNNVDWNGNTYSNKALSYGSVQDWFNNKSYSDRLYDSNSIYGYQIKKHGCG